MTALVLLTGEGHSLVDLDTSDRWEGYEWTGAARLAGYQYAYRVSPTGDWTLFAAEHSVTVPNTLNFSALTDTPQGFVYGRLYRGPGNTYYWLGWAPFDNSGTPRTHWQGQLYVLSPGVPPQLVWSGARPHTLPVQSYTALYDFDLPGAAGSEHAWLEFDGTALTYFEPGAGVVTFSGSAGYVTASFASTPEGDVYARTDVVAPVVTIDLRTVNAMLPGAQVQSVGLDGVTFSMSDGSARALAASLFAGVTAHPIQTFNAPIPSTQPAVWQDIVGAAQEWPY